MVDPSAAAFTAAGIYRAGVAIVFQRNLGFAPNVTQLTADLVAIVRTVQPDTTSPAQDGLGASAPGVINQDQRLVILMAQDLVDGGVSLPIVVGDQIIIPSTGELLNVDRIDPYKRAFAGAIELYASAVT
jgi:hypothetical protein